MVLFSNTEVRKSTCQKAPVGAPHTSDVYIYKKKRKTCQKWSSREGRPEIQKNRKPKFSFEGDF